MILEALARPVGHLTGDQVYRLARRRLPRISLGTVYRNLEVLSEAGLIRRLELGGTRRRYDANAAPHHHIRCLRCGKVEDIVVPPTPGLEQEARAASGYEVVAHHLELVGYCPRCQPRRARRESPTPGRGERS